MASPVRLSFEGFCAAIATAIDLPAERVLSCSTAVLDLGLDELSFASLVLAVEELNPDFRLPDQADIQELTLQDIHHFYSVMTSGHSGRGGES